MKRVSFFMVAVLAFSMASSVQAKGRFATLLGSGDIYDVGQAVTISLLAFGMGAQKAQWHKPISRVITPTVFQLAALLNLGRSIYSATR